MTAGPSALLGVVASTAAAAAVLSWLPPGPRWPTAPADHRQAPADEPGWLHRGRWVWALLAGLGGALFVSGPAGPPVGIGAAVLAWVVIGRSEPAPSRRRREAVERELPMLVQLLVTALEAGRDVGDAVRLVCEALPGPAALVLAGVPARLALGVPAELAWGPVLDRSELAPLGRAMVRAQRSGSSVSQEAARLAHDLERRAGLRVEERARTVGVKAAVPLGVCLLPSFLLLGVVPLVVALLTSLSL